VLRFKRKTGFASGVGIKLLLRDIMKCNKATVRTNCKPKPKRCYSKFMKGN
jgi:hypothetical protein